MDSSDVLGPAGKEPNKCLIFGTVSEDKGLS